MKKRVGRPKGSKNKALETATPKSCGCVSRESVVTPESSCTQLALNQVTHANAIKNLEIAVNSLSQGINNLVQNTNNALSEVAKKIQASESRVCDIEKAVSVRKESENGSDVESLT